MASVNVTNIFGNQDVDNKTWTVEGAVVTYSSGGDDNPSDMVPVFMSQINMTYQRTVQHLYPLNAGNTGQITRCAILGIPRGQLTVAGIYSPTAYGLPDFLKAFGNACSDASQNYMVIHPYPTGWCDSGKFIEAGTATVQEHQSWVLGGVHLESLGIQIQAGETSYSTMPLTFSFTSLKLTTDGAYGDQVTQTTSDYAPQS